jgi:hypothetical protein
MLLLLVLLGLGIGIRHHSSWELAFRRVGVESAYLNLLIYKDLGQS